MATELELTIPMSTSSTNSSNNNSSNMLFSVDASSNSSSNQYDELRTKSSAFLREFDNWISSKKNEYVHGRLQHQRTTANNSGTYLQDQLLQHLIAHIFFLSRRSSRKLYKADRIFRCESCGNIIWCVVAFPNTTQ